ncbi:hypothetical protein ACFVYG_19345 [Streptomyces sp. NPDC058256]|uniref:hypothetical protein n=1 Tax=Streptomyces sp. NPDC058256 TaxID=3346408 RepID=UPI0036EB96E8
MRVSVWDGPTSRRPGKDDHRHSLRAPRHHRRQLIDLPQDVLALLGTAAVTDSQESTEMPPAHLGNLWSSAVG